jgi:hypothetical protein
MESSAIPGNGRKTYQNPGVRLFFDEVVSRALSDREAQLIVRASAPQIALSLEVTRRTGVLRMKLWL